VVWRSILREKVVLVTWTDKLVFYGLSGRADRISRDLNLNVRVGDRRLNSCSSPFNLVVVRFIEGIKILGCLIELGILLHRHVVNILSRTAPSAAC